jgi:hypothetical protein
MKIKKRWILLILSVLFLLTIPKSIQIILEVTYMNKMNALYQVDNLESDDPSSLVLTYGKEMVQIVETETNQTSYMDPWNHKITLMNLSLVVNGKKLDTLKNYPVRVESQGFNRYYGDIAFLNVKDKEKNKENLVIILKKTRELEKTNKKGDLIGTVPDEKLKYTSFTIEKTGKITKENFSFNNRNKYQTDLLSSGYLTSYPIGYYTDSLMNMGYAGYSPLIYPILFPLLFSILGVVLLIFYFLIKKFKK